MRPGRVLGPALASIAIACSPTVVDVPRARDAEEAWEEHFRRAQRYENGEFWDRAEDEYERALREARRLPSDDDRVSRTLLAMAEFHLDLGELDAAESDYRAVIAREERRVGPYSEEVAGIQNALGVLYTDLGRLDEARDLLATALATRLAVHGENSTLAAVASQNLGEVYRRKEAYASLIKLGKRLAVGEVDLYSDGEEEVIAHVTCTYSIPPD